MNPTQPSVAALLLAAGSGQRMRSAANSGNKILLAIDGKPVIQYSLDTFSHHPAIQQIVVVYRHQDESLIRDLLSGTTIPMVCGGKERFDSVYNGLHFLSRHQPPEIILIHDCARPFATSRMIDDAIVAAQRHGAATVAIPQTDTLKRMEQGLLVETVPRQNLYRIQTPQAFRFDLIWKAHQDFHQNPDPSVTDDCMLLERQNLPVAYVEGSETNLKLTTPFDLQIAVLMAKNNLPSLSSDR